MNNQHQKNIKHDLKNIFSAIGNKKSESIIQSVSNYFAGSEATSNKIKNTEFSKQEETEKLKNFAEENFY